MYYYLYVYFFFVLIGLFGYLTFKRFDWTNGKRGALCGRSCADDRSRYNPLNVEFASDVKWASVQLKLCVLFVCFWFCFDWLIDWLTSSTKFDLEWSVGDAADFSCLFDWRSLFLRLLFSLKIERVTLILYFHILISNI